jgi:DNA-binding NarL/FixJ family response regulator
MRVLIVGEDPLARAGLAALLAPATDVAIVGQVGGQSSDPVAEWRTYEPDVVLWDLGWAPSASALAQLADLEDAGAGIVALVADGTQASEVWGVGARGLLLRETGLRPLTAALRAVAEGLTVVSPDLAITVYPPSRPDQAPPPALREELTPREAEVLTLLAQGLPNKSIAQRLGISEHTVKFHVNAIMGKLGAQSRTEAAVLATRLGLMPL